MPTNPQVPISPDFHANILHGINGVPIDSVIRADGLKALAVDAVLSAVIADVKITGVGGEVVTGNFDSTNQNEASIALFVRAAMTAHDGSQAAGSMNVPVEARTAANFVGLGNNAVTGLHTLSLGLGFDPISSTLKEALAIPELTNGTSVSTGVYETRKSGYWSCVRQRRFSLTNPTDNTPIAFEATFSTTTPALLMSNNAAAVRMIIRAIQIVITTNTTNPVRVIIKIDSANRFSAGGTATTPQNENSGGGASAITQASFNSTATAEGGGTKRVLQWEVPKGQSNPFNFSLEDEVIIGLTGSLLIYVFDSAGAAAPSGFINVDYEEAA